MRLRIFPALVALFVGLPLLDVVLLVFLGKYLTLWPTVALVIVSGFVGAGLARGQGIQVWNQIRRDLSTGQMPSQGILDGVIILFAGGLLAAPGFITDLIGLALLLPPVRRPIKAFFRHRLEQAMERAVTQGTVSYLRGG